MNVQELIDILEKIDDKNRQVYLRGNDLFFIPVTDVCDMSDNLIGLISGEREVTVEKAIESLYNAPIISGVKPIGLNN